MCDEQIRSPGPKKSPQIPNFMPFQRFPSVIRIPILFARIPNPICPNCICLSPLAWILICRHLICLNFHLKWLNQFVLLHILVYKYIVSEIWSTGDYQSNQVQFFLVTTLSLPFEVPTSTSGTVICDLKCPHIPNFLPIQADSKVFGLDPESTFQTPFDQKNRNLSSKKPHILKFMPI